MYFNFDDFQKKPAAVATSLIYFGMITYTAISLATFLISSPATTKCYTYNSSSI